MVSEARTSTSQGRVRERKDDSASLSCHRTCRGMNLWGEGCGIERDA